MYHACVSSNTGKHECHEFAMNSALFAAIDSQIFLNFCCKTITALIIGRFGSHIAIAPGSSNSSSSRDIKMVVVIILSLPALAGLPANTIGRLQSVLNAAARLVCSSRKYDRVTPVLQQLHWLRMEQRIEYKLALLVYRCFHGLASSYLVNMLQRVSALDSRRRLRSAATDTVVVPPTRLHCRR